MNYTDEELFRKRAQQLKLKAKQYGGLGVLAAVGIVAAVFMFNAFSPSMPASGGLFSGSAKCMSSNRRGCISRCPSSIRS